VIDPSGLYKHNEITVHTMTRYLHRVPHMVT